jgi:O-antigen ligase
MAGRLDARIAQIFDTNFLTFLRQADDPFMDLANRLRFAERVIYGMAAYRTFSLHPWLGVGLGKVGFFFHETVHPLGYHLPEILRIISGEAVLPNAKNLWIRLLAETGVVGFSSFLIWLMAIGLGALRLFSNSKVVLGVIGLAGSLALTAQFFEGFSVDSFALPQLWILPGLVTAGLSIAARAQRGDESG